MPGLIRVTGAVCAVLTLLAGPARAEVTAADAAALSDNLRAWVVGLLGPLADAATLPWTIGPDGERYRMDLKLAAPAGHALDAAGPASLYLRPRPDGSWAVEDLRWPSTIRLAAPDGKPLLALSIGAQQASGEIDPALVRPSHLEGSLNDLVETAGGGGRETTARFHTISYRTSWRPDAAGGLDLASHSATEGYLQNGRFADGSELRIEIGKVGGDLTAKGVPAAALAPLLRRAVALVTDLGQEAQGGRATMPAPERGATIKDLVTGAGELFSSLEASQSWSAIRVAAGGRNAKLDRARLAIAAGAPGGKADLRLRLEADGFDTSLAEGPLRDLLPSHIVLAPRISGVPKAALFDVLANAADSPAPAAALLGLIADNPVRVAIEVLELDLGPARLRGSGEVQIAGPDQMVGNATVRAHGLDDLIRLAGKTEEAKPALPFLIMLKGMGEPGGPGETVWRVAYAAGKLTVNGADVADMMSR